MCAYLVLLAGGRAGEAGVSCAAEASSSPHLAPSTVTLFRVLPAIVCFLESGRLEAPPKLGSPGRSVPAWQEEGQVFRFGDFFLLLERF